MAAKGFATITRSFALLAAFQSLPPPLYAQEPLSSLTRPDRKIAEPSDRRQQIVNFSDWADTDGNRISAHAGGMLRVDDTYYWYGGDMGINPGGMFNQRVYNPGEDPISWKRYFYGYNVYSSKDLVNWNHEGKALEAPDKGFLSLYVSGRPHVIYNQKTKKYVMYHYYYPIYPGCLLMTATSDSPIGPFTDHKIVEAGSPNGHVGDMNVIVDEAEAAYVIYDDTSFDIRADRLTDDYLDSKKDGVLLMKRRQEAPAMVYFKGKYILATSGVDGFGATETTIAVADSPLGPFSDKQIISQNKSWDSQLTDMIVVPEHDYVLVMFDQWLTPDPDDIDKSRYLWLPMTFDPETGKATLHYREAWNPSVPAFN